MNSISSCQSIRILYIPPYYENHFDLALDRLITHDKHVEYQLFTIDKRFFTTTTTVDLNLLLSICRTIIHEEHIQMLITDSHIGQLIVAKLCQEYPQIHSGGMNFLNTLEYTNRFLLINLFDVDQCIPTLLIDITEDWERNFQSVQMFLAGNKIDGYVKSVYGFDNQLSSFRFSNWENYTQNLHDYIELYKQQHKISLLDLFHIYVSPQHYPHLFKSTYLVQPFFDLVTYPHWRLVIANACIFDKEIIMWPLVDGYSGW
jgi:hypothetical protein